MTTVIGTEDLLRALAPRVLGAVVRRYGHFADAEDAVQEALLTATTTWPTAGEPDNPLGWLIRVASRRMVDHYRRDDARRRREDLAASWSVTRADPDTVPEADHDDTLILMFLCCHPALSPATAIPLTLRAVGGLSTREIAGAFLMPEATMAQRISRAKATIKESDEPFSLPTPDQRASRLRSVLHVLYLLFNEGYISNSGPDLARTDLSGEAIGLARSVRVALPDDPEVAGLLALMVLNDARRPARTAADGELVPLAEQDRSLWDRSLIIEGVTLVTAALQLGPAGEYVVQAAVAALHDQARCYVDTDWSEILSLYGRLERMTGNPMVTLNRSVALAMVDGPRAGLALLEEVAEQMGHHHRFQAVRAHLLEMAGATASAMDGFRAAAAGATNLREQQYLTKKAARLAAELP